MNYRLWLNDLDCGVAADQYAFDWRDAMQKRYVDGQVRIEPAPDAEITFPTGDDEEGEKIDPSHVTVIRCPYCQAVTSFPGFDAMICCRCPECDGFIDARPPVV